MGTLTERPIEAEMRNRMGLEQDDDLAEAMRRALAASDETGLSDGTDRPVATAAELDAELDAHNDEVVVVVAIPLDPFAPRCGHCGELTEEGPTFCPSCERNTVGRRTDR